MNLAHKVIGALEELKINISAEARHEVRLAALLHDIGHSVFSHGSEFFYRTFQEFSDVLRDPELTCGSPSESECLNYCVITSNEFRTLLWEPIKKKCKADGKCRDLYGFLDDIQLENVAKMIIGAPPGDKPSKCFLTEIINGPLDVDKLDYLSRDSYFTGVNLAVDIDRLLPSFRVASRENHERSNRTESRLVVNQGGIAVVEQLLFARMLLYDSVYHHHKVRAANSALQSIFEVYHKGKYWPTTSRTLSSAADFLEIDEFSFFGTQYKNKKLNLAIQALRTRDLPQRVLVLTPRVLIDKQSHTKWSMRSSEFTNREDPLACKNAIRFFDKIRKKILSYAKAAGAVDLNIRDITIDIPSPPRIGRLGEATLIQLVDDYCVPLSVLFPFNKVVNNYSVQYKYRSYIFAPEKWASQVAYAAFRAFADFGIKANNLALILAHQDKGLTHDLLMRNHVAIPDWQKDYYVPDADGSAAAQ